MTSVTVEICMLCKRRPVDPESPDGWCLACWQERVAAIDKQSSKDPATPDRDEPPTGETGPAGASRESSLRFVSSTELAALAPADVDWIWEGYIAAGSLVLIAGKPKSGKSTLLAALMDAVASRASTFLGRPLSGGPVVYVAEEAAGTLLHKLPQHDDLRVLTRDAAFPKPAWPVLIAAAVDEAERVGARLLVVDTFSFWAAMAAEREKDSGAVQQAMNVLIDATPRVPIVLATHQRKGGGDDGEGVRGSSAFAGSVDVILELERLPKAPAGQRQLLALSRWPDTPTALVIDRDPATSAWRSVGEAADRDDAAAVSWQARLSQALPDTEPGVTIGDLEVLLGDSKRGGAGWYRALQRGVEEGSVTRVGEGKRGDAYRYFTRPQDSVQGFCADGPHTNAQKRDSFCAANPYTPLKGGGFPHTNDSNGHTGRPHTNGRTLADLSDDELLAAVPGGTLEEPA